MRFLIDECLHESLVGVAHGAGFEATHVNHLGLSGKPDWELAERIVNAAQAALKNQPSLRAAITAWKRAAAPIRGLRFHDLRHQAITEMAEAGASDATLMAVAGHMSRRMLEHYSHVRMAAKRTALEKLESGLMAGPSATCQPESRKAI